MGGGLAGGTVSHSVTCGSSHDRTPTWRPNARLSWPRSSRRTGASRRRWGRCCSGRRRAGLAAGGVRPGPRLKRPPRLPAKGRPRATRGPQPPRLGFLPGTDGRGLLPRARDLLSPCPWDPGTPRLCTTQLSTLQPGWPLPRAPAKGQAVDEEGTLAGRLGSAPTS